MSGHHTHPIHEMPNPAPAPTVPDDVGIPNQLRAQQDLTADPDYYHRNSKAIPSTRTEVPSQSAAPRTTTMTGRSAGHPMAHHHHEHSDEDSHPNRRKHGKHRHRHRSHSRDRASDHQSVVTAYREIEPISGAADRVGQ